MRERKITIKEAAERIGISIDNLRYYERIGLILPIPRNKSGIRDYDESTLYINELLNLGLEVKVDKSKVNNKKKKN